MKSTVINDITQFMLNDAGVSVCWLYGSRAKGNHSETSDYDLAVAFEYEDHADVAPLAELREERLQRNVLDYLLNKIPAIELSIVDINRAPVPVAYSIISDGIVLCAKSPLRLCSEMQRVWSLWESYAYEFERHRSSNPL